MDPITSRPVIMYTSAKVGDIGPWPKRKALTPFDQKWQAAIRRLSLLGVSARDNSKHWAIRRLSQLLVFYTLIFEYPLLPVSPACNWGQGLVFEGVLPRMRSWQSRFEGYSVGFGFNKFKGVGDSHRSEEIRWWFILDENQKLNGLSLSGKDRGRNLRRGSKEVIPNGP
jgi:hypothetical protein